MILRLKFNPMQSMLYQVVMFLLVPLIFVTGVLLWDVKGFNGMVESFGGVRVVDTVHVLLYIFFVFYIILHGYLGSLGQAFSANYKAMFLTGYEEAEAQHARGESKTA